MVNLYGVHHGPATSKIGSFSEVGLKQKSEKPKARTSPPVDSSVVTKQDDTEAATAAPKVEESAQKEALLVGRA